MLAPWKKSYDKPIQHIKKQRYHFADKGPSSQSYGFSSSREKAEHQRIDAFELWDWESLGQQGGSNQSILKEINSEYSLEGLMLKLTLHYFGLLMQTADSLENTLMLEKTEGKRRRGQQRMRWLDSISGLNGHEFEQTLWDSEEQRLAGCSPRRRRVRSDLATEQ